MTANKGGHAMRVISGTRKGQPLKAVPGTNTRPTTDKVKESIFNRIGPYFASGRGLDLYAGSGGLGIEAISRGLEHMIFIDSSRQALQTLRSNLKACRFEDQSEVYKNDSLRALKALAKRHAAFDVIFLDPPYASQKLAQEVELFLEYELLNPGCLIVCEHDANVQLPAKIKNVVMEHEDKYGDTKVSIFSYLGLQQNNEEE
ncbi:16S rRNA (guanine(966)-N(2))-methyltransferase RsmD [Bacillus sp. FJAT-44742]|uniref:16S rRNA (guanine(966)-N(2))-methyltransferase RsmD n=1 Tax=Bacillus sp. FJAT-44742 TaxID=2014005 RepID=UPI003FA4BEEC